LSRGSVQGNPSGEHVAVAGVSHGGLWLVDCSPGGLPQSGRVRQNRV
jgi:hypothetical protein